MSNRRNCGCGRCGQKNQKSCCEAIEKAIGRYFLESGQVVDATVFNTQFPDLAENIPRTQLFEQFLVQQNAVVRAAFAALNECTICDNECCAAAAEAIANSGIGYVNLAFQAALSIGNPLALPDGSLFKTLQQVLQLVATGNQESIALILAVAGCAMPI